MRKILPMRAGLIGHHIVSGNANSSVLASLVARAVSLGRGTASVAAASQAAGASSNNLQPVWDAVIPTQDLIVGNPYSFDLNTVCTDPEGAVLSYFHDGSLPAGLALVGSVVSGTPTAAGSPAVVFTARDEQAVEASWLQRSTAAGVFYSNNFSWRDQAKTLPITNDTDLRNSAAAIGGTTSLITFDMTNKLSGAGSCKLRMPASQFGAYSGWMFSFAGIGTSAKTAVKHQFYVQFAFYADSVYRSFFYGSNNTWGGKIAIIEAPDSSFDPGEIVVRRWSPPGGFVKGYWISGPGNVEEFYLSWPSIGSDFTFNNFLDRGSPTVSNANTLQQRHGINFNDQGSSTGSDPDYQHAALLQSNGWTVIEAYVDQVNDVIKVWIAPYGSAPTLLMGTLNANLPAIGTLDGSASNPAQLYTGMQLTNFPNTVTNWPGSDTFVAYDEVICSDSQINFPGGFALPNPGTQVPANYPPAGATENSG